MSDYTRAIIDWSGTLDDLHWTLGYDHEEDCDTITIKLLSGNIYEYLHNNAGMDYHRDTFNEIFHHPLCDDIFIDYRYLPDVTKTIYNDLEMFKSFLETEFNCVVVKDESTDSKLWSKYAISTTRYSLFEHRTNELRFKDDKTIVFLFDENGDKLYKSFGNDYQCVLEYLKEQLFHR